MVNQKVRDRIYSNKIKIILEKIGMNQQELSQLTDINPSYLSKIILGKKRCLSLATALKISNALQHPVEEVFLAKKRQVLVNEEED